MKTVLTVGVFDLLHWGHFELFRRAKELAGADGRLVVAVQLDDFVIKYKPTTKLVYEWETRCKMIRALRYVDEVVPYGDVDKDIAKCEFNIFAIGGDQIHAGFQRAVQWCKEHGKEVVVLGRTEGISSSRIREGGLS